MGVHRKKVGPIRQKWSKKNRSPRPAAFLDRDGTLIRFRSVVSKTAHMRPFVTTRALRKLQKRGFLLIGITNQPAIEKDEVSRVEAQKLNEILYSNLQKMGVKFDAIYTCPHRHITDCGCKKPEQGMLDTAQNDFRIDMKNSWLIGDTHTDMETGKRARLKTILLATGSSNKDKQYFHTPGTYASRTLVDAVRRIEENSGL